MSTALLRRAEPRGTSTVPTVVLAVFVFLLWSTVALGLDSGRVQLPGAHVWRLPFFFGLPLALLALLWFRDGRVLRRLAAAVWIEFGALIGAYLVISIPMLAYALLVLLASALVARRWPGGVALTTFIVVGASGSINAFTPLHQIGPAIDILLVGLWLGLLPQLVSRRREYGYVLWPGIVAILGFGLFSLICVFFAPDVGEGLRAFRLSFWYMLALVAVAYFGWRPHTMRWLAGAFVVVCALVGAYATLRWAIGPAGKERAVAANTGSFAYNSFDNEIKPQGSLANGAALGLWASVALPFCFAAALGMRGKVRLVAMAAVPLIVIGLLASQLRAGAVAGVIGVLVVLVAYQLSRGFPGPRLGTGASALLGLVIASVLIFPATAGKTPEKLNRYKNILTPSKDASYQGRRYKWSEALRDSPRHPLGHGLGTAGIRQDNQRFLSLATSGDVDNSYVKVAYEQGIVAMVFLFVALALLFVGLLWRGIWTREAQRATVAIGAAGSLIALMVSYVSRNFIESIPSLTAWMIVGLGVAQFSRVRRDNTGDA